MYESDRQLTVRCNDRGPRPLLDDLIGRAVAGWLTDFLKPVGSRFVLLPIWLFGWQQ